MRQRVAPEELPEKVIIGGILIRAGRHVWISDAQGHTERIDLEEPATDATMEAAALLLEDDQTAEIDDPDAITAVRHLLTER